MKELLKALKEFNKVEHVFEDDFLESIQYGTASDGYAVRIPDFAPVLIYKDDDPADNYRKLIMYLVEVKSEQFNQKNKDKKIRNYYNDWLTFKTAYYVTKAIFYSCIDDVTDKGEVNAYLAALLGKVNHNTVVLDMHIDPADISAHAENIFMYLGTTRAIRDLNMKYLETRECHWEFHLWHLTPHYLIDHYEYIFYLGNEMSKLEDCPYNYIAKEYYYNRFYEKCRKNASQR